MADVNLSLDAIIEKKEKSGRGRGAGRGGAAMRGRGGAGGAMRGRGGPSRRARGARAAAQPYVNQRAMHMPGDVNGQWQHDLYGAAPMRSSVVRSAPAVQSNKLLISNLEAGVTDEDIHELFGRFGPVSKAFVHFDRTGNSLGTAEVIFTNASAASQAHKEYNNVLLDGKPMHIELVADPSALARASAPVSVMMPAQQVAMAMPSRGGRGRGAGRGVRGGAIAGRGVGRGAVRGRGAGRGAARGRGGAGRGGRREREPEPTASNLDDQLDKWRGKTVESTPDGLDAALEAYKKKAESKEE